AAADGDRVGGVGQPAGVARGLPVHEVVLAVRERGGPAVPADPRGGRSQRHPRALPRAGEVDREAAGDRPVGQLPVEDRDGGGARHALTCVGGRRVATPGRRRRAAGGGRGGGGRAGGWRGGTGGGGGGRRGAGGGPGRRAGGGGRAPAASHSNSGAYLSSVSR